MSKEQSEKIKITFNSTFKANQTVWLVERYDDGFFEVEKHKIIGFEYYPDKSYPSVNYILNDEYDSKEDWEVFANYKEAVDYCKSLNSKIGD